MSLSAEPKKADSEVELAEAIADQVPAFDLLQSLLSEQQSLSAVESFAESHESGELPSQAQYYQRLLPATPPSPEEQYAFEVDLDKCSGCKACVVACHTMNGLEEDESWRRVGNLVSGAEQAYVTTACHHCLDPGCLNGCPVAAYEKDPHTGIVKHLDDQCIGCKYCTMMCPYEVPVYSERLGIVRKCDMCSQRLAVGEAPACVQSCPNEAIAIRKVTSKKQIPSLPIVYGAPSSSITQPTTQYVGWESSDSNQVHAQDENIDHPAESHWPLAAMLVGTQASVGLVVIECISLCVQILASSGSEWNFGLPSLGLACLLALTGLAIAPKHLGQPTRAWKIFLGLRKSWLSREGVLLGQYFGLLLASIAMVGLRETNLLPSWQYFIPNWLPVATLLATLASGLLGLYASAMIYIATQRELWKWQATFPLFLGSSVVAGLGAWGVLAAYNQSPGSASILVAAAMTLASKLAWEQRALWGTASNADEPLRFRSKTLIQQSLSKLLSARLLMSGLAMGSWLLAALGLTLGLGPAASAWLCGCGLFCCLLGEYSERLLYFSSIVTPRMPGSLA